MTRRMKNVIFVVAFFSLLVTACSSAATPTVSATEPVSQAETLAPTQTAQPNPTSAPAEPELAPVDVPQLP
ncbi:MAG: hypothetical protein JW862_19790, partial [Anaerolineales bacterium]|nr:hypothetical protein [Anaerolineales bacterium]